jgi:hypothetical protein
LHTYIQEGGLSTGVIKLGDYIDLESLQVANYDTRGAFHHASNILLNNGEYLLRLIVVGINSFNGKNGNTTPHVVFQFKNLPVTRRMAGGEKRYALSEMRSYLTGNFFAGLKNAGVPESVFWAPSRRLWNTWGEWDVIQDLLWLPTEYEMFGSTVMSNSTYETSGNQARLSYYQGDGDRKKYGVNSSANHYWLSSAGTYESFNTFVHVNTNGGPNYANVFDELGIAPAFCVQ